MYRSSFSGIEEWQTPKKIPFRLSIHFYTMETTKLEEECGYIYQNEVADAMSRAPTASRRRAKLAGAISPQLQVEQEIMSACAILRRRQ